MTPVGDSDAKGVSTVESVCRKMSVISLSENASNVAEILLFERMQSFLVRIMG